jgi:hypothetical protein
MANTIQIKRKLTAGPPLPGDLVDGELCLVIPDQALYVRVDSSTVIQVNGGGSSAIEHFSATKNSTTQSISSTWTTLSGWDLDIPCSSIDFSTGGVITFLEKATYQFAVSVEHSNVGISNRVQLDVRVANSPDKPGQTLDASLEWHNYSARNATQDQGGVFGLWIKTYSAGDSIGIQAKTIGGVIQIPQDYARIYAIRLD